MADTLAITQSIGRHANYATQESHRLGLITGYVIEKMADLISQAEIAKISEDEVREAFLRGVRAAESILEIAEIYSLEASEKFQSRQGAYTDLLSFGMASIERSTAALRR